MQPSHITLPNAIEVKIELKSLVAWQLQQFYQTGFIMGLSHSKTKPMMYQTEIYDFVSDSNLKSWATVYIHILLFIADMTCHLSLSLPIFFKNFEPLCCHLTGVFNPWVLSFPELQLLWAHLYPLVYFLSGMLLF